MTSVPLLPGGVPPRRSLPPGVVDGDITSLINLDIDLIISPIEISGRVEWGLVADEPPIRISPNLGIAERDHLVTQLCDLDGRALPVAGAIAGVSHLGGQFLGPCQHIVHIAHRGIHLVQPGGSGLDIPELLVRCRHEPLQIQDLWALTGSSDGWLIRDPLETCCWRVFTFPAADRALHHHLHVRIFGYAHGYHPSFLLFNQAENRIQHFGSSCYPLWPPLVSFDTS